MWWLLCAALQIFLIVSGIRNEQHTGLWSWSKFGFALGFAVLESVIAVVPVMSIDLHSPRFWPVVGTAWAIAVANFIWFIIVCRRRKLPDGRTSLQAYRDEQRKL